MRVSSVIVAVFSDGTLKSTRITTFYWPDRCANRELGMGPSLNRVRDQESEIGIRDQWPGMEQLMLTTVHCQLFTGLLDQEADQVTTRWNSHSLSYSSALDALATPWSAKIDDGERELPL